MAKVLIVDDEQSYRRYISARLTRDGHTVETAATGADGIDIGMAFGPDLLIVDWILEHGDLGIRVADALHRRNPELQTILITGFSAKQALKESEGRPIVRCIEKPFEIDDLAAAVGEALATDQRDGGS
jgi:DNA-binding NtrC family response regulator